MRSIPQIARLLILPLIVACMFPIGSFAAPQAMQLISRGVPAYASSDIAANANDSNYGTAWRGQVPGWIAYNLSKVPAGQREQVLVVWYNNDTYDYDHSIKNTGGYNIPKTYTIEGNAAGDSNDAPTTGWVSLLSVTGNIYHSRQHLINLSGYNWLRVNITEADSLSGNTASINLDVYDGSHGIQDDWIFYGDSITAGGMVINGSGSGSFSQMINSAKPNFFPVAENGGVGSILSIHGAQNINTWLSVFPGKYVGISYGTNDSWGNQAGTAAYYNNLASIVEAVIAAGKTPVIPKIPWARLSDIQRFAPDYNAQIDALYQAYPQIIKGPDFWTFFQKNQSCISSDNVHPTAEGYNAMRQQWADTMLAAVYGSSTIKYGDLNNDGSIDALDLVQIKTYLLHIITGKDINLDAADLNLDKSVDAIDFALLKQYMLRVINTLPVTD